MLEENKKKFITPVSRDIRTRGLRILFNEYGIYETDIPEEIEALRALHPQVVEVDMKNLPGKPEVFMSRDKALVVIPDESSIIEDITL